MQTRHVDKTVGCRQRDLLADRPVERHVERAAETLTPVDPAGHRDVDIEVVARRGRGQADRIATGDQQEWGDAVDADVEQSAGPACVDAVIALSSCPSGS